MKKLLALTLALAMVLSMAAVSFAATAVVNPIVGVKDTMFKWDSNSKRIVENTAGKVEPGDTVYFALIGMDGSKEVPVYEAEAVRGLKIKDEWDLGASYVENVEVVKRNAEYANPALFANCFNNLTTADLAGQKHYVYFIAVELKDVFKTEMDVSGIIKMSKSATKNSAGASNNDRLNYDDDQFVVDITAAFENVVADSSYSATIGGDKLVYKFDSSHLAEDDEYEFTIVDSDIATFTVNTKGQDTLIMTANNDFVASIAAKYPDANLDFITIEASKPFNRGGDLKIYSDEDDKNIYMVVDGKVRSARAKYDEYEGAYVMKTRDLAGTYVISDIELELAPETVAPEVKPAVPSVPAEKPFNPGTGAAC